MIFDRSLRKGAQARSAPNMLIVNQQGDVIAGTVERRDGDEYFAEAIRKLALGLQRGELPPCVELEDGRCLRAFSLYGFSATYAVFCEPKRQPISMPGLLARYSFTLREAQVVALMARGATNHDIADALSISETTVISHVRNAGLKLGCTKRSTIIARLLDFDDDIDAIRSRSEAQDVARAEVRLTRRP